MRLTYVNSLWTWLHRSQPWQFKPWVYARALDAPEGKEQSGEKRVSHRRVRRPR